MDPQLDASVAIDPPPVFRTGQRGHRHGGARDVDEPGPARRRYARGAAGAAALRAHRQARDLPVSIGRSGPDGSVRLQAAAARSARLGTARVDPDGAASDRHDLDAGDLPGGAAELQVRAARTIGRVGQRPAAAHRKGRRRSLLRQVDVHRGDQPRSGHHVFPDGRPAGRPAEHRSVDFLRSGQREQRSAVVRGHGVAGHRQGPATSRCTTGCGEVVSCRASTRA